MTGRLRVILLCFALVLALSAAAPRKRGRRIVPTPSGPLAGRIAKILDQTPAKDAFWGIEIRDLKTRQIIFAQNSDHFFVPASNTKLFTTALALSRLGPNYQFHTRVIRNGRDLVLVGAGDPNLSGRTMPYDSQASDPAPLAAINQLADQIVATGIRHIEGDIVGDDSAFVYEPYAPGWGLTDTFEEDGAPISALCVDDNAAKLEIIPALADAALVQTNWLLPFDLFSIDNSLVTDSEARRSINFERLPGSRQARLWGAVPPDQPVAPITAAVDDPARFAAQALQDALVRRGVICDGHAIARHQLPGAPDLPPLTGQLVTERVSVPLLDAVTVVDKISQNLHAEILLRDVALAGTGRGTRQGGLEAMASFLAPAGIGADDYHFSDGSGLSRYNIVTPHAIASLLEYMAGTPLHEEWLSLLPVGGVDGSLRLRFQAVRLNGEIHAKTGSLTHASALSGYAVRKDGSSLAFAILVNNYGVPPTAIREVIDQLSAAIF